MDIQSPAPRVRDMGNARLVAMAGFLLALPLFGISAFIPTQLPVATIYLAAWAALACLIHSSITTNPINSGDPLLRSLLCFCIYCMFSAAYGYWHLSGEGKATFHFSTGDVSYLNVSSQRLVQLMFAVIAFESIRQSKWSPERLMHWWLMGTSIAALVHASVYVVSTDDLAQRAGTFPEGNQGGLYYLISLFLALEYRRRQGSRQATIFVFLSAAGLLLTRSSAGLLVCFFVLGIKYVLHAKTNVSRIARTALLTLILGASYLVVQDNSLNFALTEKLFEEEITSNSFSRIDRLASIDTALDLFYKTPWLGHGLQSYGFLANDYLEGPLLRVYDESFRRIPNNIYAEIAAELGAVGLILFGVFAIRLIRLIWSSAFDLHRNLLTGVLCVLVYWLAFPTYSVLFIWAFFGLACAASRRSQQPRTRSKRHSNVKRRHIPTGAQQLTLQ